MTDKEQGTLSLKVMRLTRPNFFPSLPIYPDLAGAEESGATGALKGSINDFYLKYGIQSDENQRSEQKKPKGLIYPLTENLILPKTFGTLYLGETFVSQFLLTNESLKSISNIYSTVEMQSNSQKNLLFDSRTPKNSESQQTNSSGGTGQSEFGMGSNMTGINLASKQIYNFQVRHETKELGLHVLMCTITYIDIGGDKQVVKKVFKFNVENPLVVKTKANHCSYQPEIVFLEVQVQNMTQEPMYIERFGFEPSPEFEATDLNETGKLISNETPEMEITDNIENQEPLGNQSNLKVSPHWNSVWNTVFINPGDIRQYLYLLVPKAMKTNAGIADMDIDSVRNIRYLSGLGKLDIIWNWSFCGGGRLQTSQLVRNSPGLYPIEVDQFTMIKRNVQETELENNSDEKLQSKADSNNELSPFTAYLETPFTIECIITNTSESEMNIIVETETNEESPIVVSGPLTHILGSLDPSKSKKLLLEYLPLLPGTHSIGNLLLRDMNSNFTRKINNAFNVFVVE
ncbi:hypothetical protein BB558_005415 [Smittium angustum]|uniref:Trafficking protein particle complex subunit 13 n=1 Tax=Smittium angustum TaxID=133377 RepID=A0A2U1J0K7_SMIAN|nr:hypothetical protein BB558_005415 [Smittium angustum]